MRWNLQFAVALFFLTNSLACFSQASDQSTTTIRDYQGRTAYSYIRPDGNKLVEGRGYYPHVSAVDIALEGKPVWIVALPYNTGSLWVSISESGAIQAFIIDGTTSIETTLNLNHMPPGTPPVLVETDGDYRLLGTEEYSGNFLTHPVFVHGSQHSLSLDAEGRIHLSKESKPIDVGALPDGRVLVSDTNKLLLLTNPSRQYGHGILGDTLEATEISLISLDSVPVTVRKISLPADKVIESLFPLWSDLDTDGKRDIIVTVSDTKGGARLQAYGEDGSLMAESPAIGFPFRWMHQIAVAPFGPNKEVEIASIRTPHIGGIVEYYQLQNNKLRLVASRKGYSSHIIGSRNLDMAIAGDIDGDGRLDLAVPDQTFNRIAFLQRTPAGVTEIGSLPIDGRMSTNLGVCQMTNNRFILGCGRADGILRIWIPETQ